MTLAQQIEAAAIGVTIAGTSGYFLHIEMANPPIHSAHVYLFAGGIFLGALIVAPGLIIAPLQQLGLALGPYLPWGKIRERSGDGGAT